MDIWTSLGDSIRARLTPEDDPELWAVIVSNIQEEAEETLSGIPKKHEFFIQIGACSHWLRPHQTRWTAAGGFAWPSGYLGGTSSRNGLPQLDWFVLFHRRDNTWDVSRKFIGKRRFTLRVAVPTRTMRHESAAIHTLLMPPLGRVDGQEHRTTFYGYRKESGRWVLKAKT